MAQATSAEPADAATVAALEARLSELEDQLAIRELTARYNESFMAGRVEEWVATFTPDAVFEMDDPSVVTTVGRDRLRALAQVIGPLGLSHHTVDHRVQVDGDRAHQTCRLLVTLQQGDRAPDSSRWLNAGRYQDDLQRTDEGWRFARRSFAPDAYFEGLPSW